MSITDISGGSGGSVRSGDEIKLPQMKRSRGAHRGVLTKRASASRQAVGALEDVQTTLEFLIDRRKILTELDSVVFMATERTVKWCQGRIKELQPSHNGGSLPRSQIFNCIKFLQYFVRGLGQFKFTCEVVQNTVQL